MEFSEDQTVDILIVDDREDGLTALEAAIDLPNVNLVRATSGRMALSKLDHHEFAVILLDVQMPELDGFETAALIRQNDKHLCAPIIFVTAINKDERYIFKGYRAGAVDYIFKPFEPQILRSKVQTFVELQRKSRQLKIHSNILQERERSERYRKLAELEVESLKRYINLADAIPHMVWKARSDGSLNYFNKIWTDYTGLTQEQSVEDGWQSAIHTNDLDNFLRIWMRAMTNREPFENECQIRRHDGEMRWHWVRAVPEFNQANEITAWIGTCTNIHDRKLTEIKLREAENLAIAANVAKTNFLANMSHEIRTPMSAILGFSEILLSQDLSMEERSRCISTIHRSGRSLLKIIDEILDISKVEVGKLAIEEIEFDLCSLLSDIFSLLSGQAFAKGLELKIKFQSDIPNRVKSDPTRLRQIITNIIGNAIKFTKKGYITVEPSWDVQTCALRFIVSDTGVGIDPSQAEKLFQPFVQADNSTTRVFGGTGLGLVLARRLAQALGGDVSLLDSSTTGGSRFSVQICAKVADKAMFVSELPNTQPLNETNFVTTGTPLKNTNILLIEDSVDNQDLISHFLKKAGAVVELSSNGLEGVHKASIQHYHAILMDIQMPYLDGYEATRKLRTGGYKGPIIALTAHALKEEREKCLSAGCTEHITKPIDPAEFIEYLALLCANECAIASS